MAALVPEEAPPIPNWLLKLEEQRTRRLKTKLGHEAGAGAPCQKCDKCPGLDLHFWRKICKLCKCGKEDHDISDEDIYGFVQFTLLGSKPVKTKGILLRGSNNEVILEFTPKGNSSDVEKYYDELPQDLVPVKGSEAAKLRKQRLQKQMPAHDVDPSLCHALTDEEIKQLEEYVAFIRKHSVGQGSIIRLPDLSQNLQNLQILPEYLPNVNNQIVDNQFPEIHPLTTINVERHQEQYEKFDLPPPVNEKTHPNFANLSKNDPNLPKNDPNKNIFKPKTPPEQINDRQVPIFAGFVKDITYKPPQLHVLEAQNPLKPVETCQNLSSVGFIKDLNYKTDTNSNIPATSCHECREKFMENSVAVSAERTQNLWHSKCFNCHTCKQPLADLLYFYHKDTDNIYCGRDYAILKGIPRCAACDELIFVREYCLAEGSTFHVKHFCCFECDQPLAGNSYLMEDGQPVCLTCFENLKAEKCRHCLKMIQPEEQGVCLQDLHWHATDLCFVCTNCKKPLLGEKMLLRNQDLYCSDYCYKNVP